jgi:hypothetical protein
VLCQACLRVQDEVQFYIRHYSGGYKCALHSGRLCKEVDCARSVACGNEIHDVAMMRFMMFP